MYGLKIEFAWSEIKYNSYQSAVLEKKLLDSTDIREGFNNSSNELKHLILTVVVSEKRTYLTSYQLQRRMLPLQWKT